MYTVFHNQLGVITTETAATKEAAEARCSQLVGGGTRTQDAFFITYTGATSSAYTARKAQ